MSYMERRVQIDRRSLLGAGAAALAANAMPTTPAEATAARMLTLTSPIKTGSATAEAQGCVAYPDIILTASKTFAFAGTYTGTFKNIMIAVPGVSPWVSVVQDGQGGWTATMDLSSVRTGPLNCRIMAWYDDPTEKGLRLDFTLLIDNPAIRRAALSVPAPATGMRQLLADDFDTLPDDSRWAFGVRPDGNQWGSGSYFMTKNEKLSDVFQLPMPSCLRIRALYDDAYVDPQSYGRKWRSGLLCTAYADGRPPIAAFRKGYVEMRAILPLGKGMWPSMWAGSLGTDGKGNEPNGLEIDGFEAYDEQADPGSYTIANNVILWIGDGKNDGVPRQMFTANFDATSDWHTYGVLVEDAQATFYIDDKVTFKIPIPEKGSKTPLYWMFDNALSSGDWPIVVPPAKHVDMWVDYIRIYSAD
ncbi:glycoside hydrolase family 16 protein [Methylobacterium mesophilicum SR1.6/6]|uniref:Glycoside hydrolase family 16 protein n=1 Tax=Methylobacterium mesophilicum SR1.6/6 TaxID=908290 RepID=A0A6B9FUQ3_9HYPH|nr:glycoside hydrolase family 16 protein [Methylobacterium mesophilicum]QGY04684.1 glycoside hydrolase family 16 protein [Methylobacterium mesophilicum SR1.6/6]